MFGNKALSEVPAGLLELLTKKPPLFVAPETGPKVARAMSPRMQLLLRRGDKDRAYLKRDGTVDRSRMIAALLLAMVNAGWTVDAAYAALMNPRNVAGRKVQARTEKNARQYVRQAYRRAVHRVRTNPSFRDRNDALVALAPLRAQAVTMTWPRGDGVAPRALGATYVAMLTLAEKKGGPVFPASYREIAESAGLGLRSTYKAVAALIRRELVKLRRKGRGTDSSTWQLVNRRVDQLNTLSPKNTDGLDDSVSSQAISHEDGTIWGNITRYHNHDLFRYRAFGKTAGMITAHLSIDLPMTPRELAQRCHCTTTTAKRHLKRLGDCGIAVQALTRKQWLRGSASLDEVAAVTGAAGRGEKQKRQHQVDRDQRARLLEQWRRGPLKMVRPASREKFNGGE